jgi:hypothetical protein
MICTEIGARKIVVLAEPPAAFAVMVIACALLICCGAV